MSMRVVCECACVFICAHIHFVVGLVISISMAHKVVTPHFILLVFRHHLPLVFVVFPSLFNALLGSQTVNTPPTPPLDSYVYDSLFDILSQPQGRGCRRAGQGRAGQCPRPVMPFDLLLRLFYEPQ